jgi:hypothetical protein
MAGCAGKPAFLADKADNAASALGVCNGACVDGCAAEKGVAAVGLGADD